MENRQRVRKINILTKIILTEKIKAFTDNYFVLNIQNVALFYISMKCELQLHCFY